MKNLYILSEERPKISVIAEILKLTTTHLKVSPTDLKEVSEIKIKPLFEKGRFTFEYLLEGYTLKGINEIKILLSKGHSSFVDFLVFVGDKKPTEGGTDVPLIAIEETKTRDNESRNTGVYQRASKFIFFEYYYPQTPIYMLYNDEQVDSGKKPSMTSIFGTSMYKNLGVDLVGKDDKWFKAFKSVEDLIKFKDSMKKPPKGNVPILIKKEDDFISVSGRISKPANAGNIGHDPNIGALTLISGTLRKLGYQDRIVLTEHGISQAYVTANPSNKFLLLCSMLDLELEGLKLDKKTIASKIPKHYWKYEESSEKVTDIFLHLACMYSGLNAIYENHAGSERSYFLDDKGNNLTMPKKTESGELYYIPDVVIKNDAEKEILLIEGKVHSRWSHGVEELGNYGTFEEDFLKEYYPDYTYAKWVTLYSNKDKNDLPHREVLMSINKHGEIALNKKAPSWLSTLIEDLKK